MRFLDYVDEKFLTQVIEELMRRGALQDPITTARRIGWKCEGWGRSGCSNREMVVFGILRRMNEANSRITVLDFRKTHFGLFRELLQRIP